MKVGIISDTHGMLRPSVKEHLAGCEMILHMGDIDSQYILDELWKIAPLHVVHGNCDGGWAYQIPWKKEVELAGKKIFMTHMPSYIPTDISMYDLVLYGHTHRYAERRAGDTVILNPGSCGPKRFDSSITMALADLTDEGISITKIDLDF